MFQHDFNLAVLLWTASGIDQKMRHDVTTATAFRQYFKDAVWTMNNTIHDNDPLTMAHILPSIFLLGVGLVSSIIAFFVEGLYHLYEKRVANKTSASLQRHSRFHVPKDVTTSTKSNKIICTCVIIIIVMLIMANAIAIGVLVGILTTTSPTTTGN